MAFTTPNPNANRKKIDESLNKPVPLTEDSSRGVRFNPNGTVDVANKNPIDNSVATTNLTKEQYNSSLDISPSAKPDALALGKVDPKVIALQRLQQLLGNLGVNKNRLGQAQPQVTDSSSLDPLQQKRVAEMAVPSTASLTEQALNKNSEKRIAGFNLANTQQAIATEDPTTVGGALKIAAAPIADIAPNAIAIANSLKNILFAEDTKAVKNARAAFTDAQQAMDAVLQGYQTGTISEGQAIGFLSTMAETNSFMESTLKYKGLDNVQYWVTKGRDLEVETAKNKVIIDNYRNKLVQAIAQKQLEQSQLQVQLGDIADATRRLQ